MPGSLQARVTLIGEMLGVPNAYGAPLELTALGVVTGEVRSMRIFCEVGDSFTPEVSFLEYAMMIGTETPLPIWNGTVYLVLGVHTGIVDRPQHQSVVSQPGPPTSVQLSVTFK